uniref:START domain-containing protein n=1 Tax=viral metagenome TaxID=1070528 RepID=A0A6C0IF83_9ZZZZ
MAKTIYEKDGFKFEKLKDNAFNLIFDVENSKLALPSLINFDLVKLIYDLNSDIYVSNNLQKLPEENAAIITLLIKHFFEDLGLPQRYSYLYITQETNDKQIIFNARSIHTDPRPIGIPETAELMPIKYMVITCDIITQNKINFNCSIVFDDDLKIPSFAEKIIGIMIHKIFTRVKKFINNY